MSLLLERPQPEEITEGRVPFNVDFPFVRKPADEAAVEKAATLTSAKGASTPSKGDLILDGYASTWQLDRDGEYVAKGAFDKHLAAYLDTNPIVLWQHSQAYPFGQVLEGGVDLTGLAVSAYVRQPVTGEEPWKFSAYQDVKAGIVRMFSIGGFFDREIIDGEILITDVELLEISVVSIGSNPASLYEAAVKAVKGLPMANPQPIQERMMQLLGMRAVTDPAVLQMDDSQRHAHYLDLSAELLRTTGGKAPGYDEYRDVEAQLAEAKVAPDEALTKLNAMLDELRAQPRPVTATSNGVKRGRVLSKSNESKLQQAATLLGEVLDSTKEAAPEDQEDGGQGAEEPGDTNADQAEE